MSEFDKMREVTILVSSSAQLAAVYALLGGASPAAVAPVKNAGTVSAKPDTAADTGVADTQEEPASAGTGPSAQTDASLSDEVDAHGWPWSADMHASTKGKTQEGLWRMKVGVKRPDPKPGFPIGDTGTASTGEESNAPATAPAETASPIEEDDEFAAFRQASEKLEAKDAEAKASIPARKWTDADLGALCNQAAVKLGDPGPVKEIIAEFVPAGEVAHSRNIPDEKRAEFAAAVEAKAGIEFAG